MNGTAGAHHELHYADRPPSRHRDYDSADFDVARTMSERREAWAGVAILLFAVVTLVLVVTNAHRHFANLVVDAPDTIVDPLPVFKPRSADMKGSVRGLIASRHAVGSIDEATPVRPGRIRFRGWIVTPSLKVAERVVAVIDGTQRYDISPDYGISRPDVAHALTRTELTNVGVDATISTSTLRGSRHRITFAAASRTALTLDSLAIDRAFEIDPHDRERPRAVAR